MRSMSSSTILNLNVCRNRLIKHFGESKCLDEITVGDAKDFYEELVRDEYSPATIGRTIKRARQFFNAAVDHELIRKNPFAKVTAPGTANSAREFFVDRETVDKLMEAYKDPEWRLIVALARFRGLRVQSEGPLMKWSDVDRKRQRVRVPSPKMEHHPGGAERIIPLFPELRPYLEAAKEAYGDSSEYLLPT